MGCRRWFVLAGTKTAHHLRDHFGRDLLQRIQILDQGRGCSLIQAVTCREDLQQTLQNGMRDSALIRVRGNCFGQLTGISMSLLGWYKSNCEWSDISSSDGKETYLLPDVQPYPAGFQLAWALCLVSDSSI